MTLNVLRPKAALLRSLLGRAEPILTIGEHNGLGAKLGETAGFDAIWASGLEISTGSKPGIARINRPLPEMTQIFREIARTTNPAKRHAHNS